MREEEEEEEKGGKGTEIVLSWVCTGGGWRLYDRVKGIRGKMGLPRTAIAGNLTVTAGLQLELRMELHQI